MRPKTPLLVERDIDPGKKKREDARAMAAERGDGEEQEGDTEKLHREAPDGAPDLQPPVEREKKDEEGKKTYGYGNRAAQMNARRLIDCLTEWSDVISSFIKRDLDITINDGGNGIHSSGSSRSKSSNEIAQTTMKTTTTGPLREIERWKERNVDRHTLY